MKGIVAELRFYIGFFIGIVILWFEYVGLMFAEWRLDRYFKKHPECKPEPLTEEEAKELERELKRLELERNRRYRKSKQGGL